MLKLAGIALIAAGTAGLWFGGVPYRTKETVVKIGAFEANAEVDRQLQIPRPVSGGAIGLGTLLLLVPRGRKK